MTKQIPNDSEREGVIKYLLDFHLADLSFFPQFSELNSWRAILTKLGLMGQNPLRYEGLGFGNISFRIENPASFIITGSQTGALKQLTDDHFSKILSVDIERNHIIAEGRLKPSSEALTHAAVYSASKTALAVVHAHSPEIWQNYSTLKLAAIEAHIAYGTPEMALAVTKLLRNERLNTKPVFVMLGHEDGVISFGNSITEASMMLIKCYVKALQCKTL